VKFTIADTLGGFVEEEKSITIKPNAVPTAGTCTVDPPVGVDWLNEFKIVAAGFTDDVTAIPLKYKYEIKLANDDAYTILDGSTNALESSVHKF
jgi:hypothetical protein